MTGSELKDWALRHLRIRTSGGYHDNSVTLYLEVHDGDGRWEAVSSEHIEIPDGCRHE